LTFYYKLIGVDLFLGKKHFNFFLLVDFFYLLKISEIYEIAEIKIDLKTYNKLK